ncbi:MAG: STAS domain-containing protein, partial [Gammaproteobacteria bacterium]|nr:STAS domain-containing protein [Gammaproteobacteria bacterium]
MVKKTTSKTAKKKKSTVKKKTLPKKKVATKKKAATKTKARATVRKSPFKSKLGHDPLAWITGDDASELGLTFDEIGSNKSVSDALDEILPISHESVAETIEPVVEEVSIEQPVIEISAASDDMDQGWGLFDDDVAVETVAISNSAKEEVSDDGSWGLFGDDEDTTSDSLPVGEGTAWGLFEDDLAAGTEVDHDALIICLPATFNVAAINNVFREFEEIVNKNHDVIVDASEVETIDAVGLQLLYASHKELQRNDCKMVIRDASERVELLSKSTFINDIIG